MADVTDSKSGCSCYILAGGTSKRFGEDKRITSIGGQTFLRRAEATLQAVTTGDIFFVGDNLYPLVKEKKRILSDAQPGRGPLGGLVAVLRHCKSNGALMIGIDTPLLQASDLRLLVSSYENTSDVITLTSDGQPEPLAAIYARHTLRFWEERLRNGKLSLVEGIRLLRWSTVPVEDSQRLLNINTQEELLKLNQMRGYETDN